MTALKVIDVFPPTSIDKRPLCCSKLSRYVVERNRVWEARNAKPMQRRRERGVAVEQCGNLARYKINSGYYCRKHGALLALDLVAETVPA